MSEVGSNGEPVIVPRTRCSCHVGSIKRCTSTQAADDESDFGEEYH